MSIAYLAVAVDWEDTDSETVVAVGCTAAAVAAD